jgi:transposase InsO family protein
LPNTAGREPWFHRYIGGTLFVDHASGFVKIYNQTSLAAPDTIGSKRRFEQEAGLSNISIKRYHGDNGVFKAAEFLNETEQLGQTVTFSGVGAHHQNGKAERVIKTIFFRARAMMLHASLTWPDSTNENLWLLNMLFISGTIILKGLSQEWHQRRFSQESNTIVDSFVMLEFGVVLPTSLTQNFKIRRSYPNGRPEAAVVSS